MPQCSIISDVKTLACVLLFAIGVQAQRQHASCISTLDYADPTYGGRIRQMEKPDGHEHNLYYYRDPWNADSTLMVGIHSDLKQQNWQVVLSTGEGCFLKTLFPISRFDWRVVWDRHDPEIFYTLKGSQLYSFNVNAGHARLLKSFAPLGMKPNGPSLNQAGDRILVITSDGVFRSYHLPEMDNERTFSIDLAAVRWDKPRYIGHRNFIVASCPKGVAIYDDTGALVHMFEGVGAGGHHDFSSDGKWAYFTLWGRGKPLAAHVVNIDGSDDRVVFRVPESEMRFVQNLHLAWPSGVNDSFIASFFPNARNLPGKYTPYLDEIVEVRLDGTHRILARSGTAYSAPKPRSGGQEDMFWAQPLARPNADGTRISFNSNRSGTIDQYILFAGGEPASQR